MESPQTDSRVKPRPVVREHAHEEHDHDKVQPTDGPDTDSEPQGFSNISAQDTGQNGTAELDIQDGTDYSIHCCSLVVRVRSAPELTNVERYNYITNMP